MPSEDNFSQECKEMMRHAEALGNLDMWAGQQELCRRYDEEGGQQVGPSRGSVGSVLHQILVDMLIRQGLKLLSIHGRGPTRIFCEVPFTLIYIAQHQPCSTATYAGTNEATCQKCNCLAALLGPRVDAFSYLKALDYMGVTLAQAVLQY